jgi:tetratricopeptide (TPR) repeat protein
MATDPVKAEQLAREALELHRKLHGEFHPETGWGHHVLANALNAQQKLDEAETHYREALTIFRRSYDDAQGAVLQQLLSLARLSKVKGDQAALDELRVKAVEIADVDSPDQDSWYYRGMLCAELGQLELAVAALSRAISLYDSHHSRLLRGQIYRELGQLEKAEQDYSRAIDLKPGEWQSWHARALLYARQNRFESAQADLVMAVKLGGVVPSDLNALAWSLATSVEPRLRNPQAAVELAEKAVAATPNDGSIWNTLGVAKYRAGNWRDAIEALQKSMELRDGGDAYDWFFLAMAHWQLGHKDKAHEWYDKAVEWMGKSAPKNEELIRFRTEAAELLGVDHPDPTVDPGSKPASPATQP